MKLARCYGNIFATLCKNDLMLSIQQLSFDYPSKTIFNNLSLGISSGEIVTLIGASGSGKTTLFKLLMGSLIKRSGMISVIGCQGKEAQHHISYMTQEDLLLPWRTVLENLLLIGELGKGKKNHTMLKQEALLFLKEVGLEGRENAYPDQLSGGMRQRVSLARILLQKRPLLLLDEPFAALDVVLREQMHALLRDIRLRHGTTILMATHDFRDAQVLSDRVILLDQGVISQEWEIDEERRHDYQSFHKELRSALTH